MTVCIAARANDGSIFCVADRMVTFGDIEMESPASKIFGMTNFLSAMPSDEDLALHSEILMDAQDKILKLIEANPKSWPLIKDCVELYVTAYKQKKAQLAEKTFLAPLKITSEDFPMMMSSMDKDIVNRITEDIINFKMPAMSVIMAGRDPLGSHIYEIHDGDSGNFNAIGYAAIGAGARHARAHFMLARQSGATQVAETLWNIYLAKKRSEVAPGVGAETDISMIGPRLGSNLMLNNDELLKQLEKVYKQTVQREAKARKLAAEEMTSYVEKLERQSEQQAVANTTPQVDAAGETTTPKSDGKPAA